VNQPVRDTIVQVCTVTILEAPHAANNAASQVPQLFEEHDVLLRMTGPILRAGMIER
jgi:hypothetical protein